MVKTSARTPWLICNEKDVRPSAAVTRAAVTSIAIAGVVSNVTKAAANHAAVVPIQPEAGQPRREAARRHSVSRLIPSSSPPRVRSRPNSTLEQPYIDSGSVVNALFLFDVVGLLRRVVRPQTSSLYLN